MTDIFVKPSPCVGVCTIDECNSLCLGCNRTIEEIAIWDDLPLAEAILMMEVVRTRTLFLWQAWEELERPTLQ